MLPSHGSYIRYALYAVWQAAARFLARDGAGIEKDPREGRRGVHAQNVNREVWICIFFICRGARERKIGLGGFSTVRDRGPAGRPQELGGCEDMYVASRRVGDVRASGIAKRRQITHMYTYVLIYLRMCI